MFCAFFSLQIMAKKIFAFFENGSYALSSSFFKGRMACKTAGMKAALLAFKGLLGSQKHKRSLSLLSLEESKEMKPGNQFSASCPKRSF